MTIKGDAAFERELPWPAPGKRAFALPPKGTRKFVDLDWGKQWLDSYYLDGFKEAADAAVVAALEPVGHPDRYFFPVAFLYRHWIELFLKQLIAVGTELFDGEAAVAHGHNLEALWNKLRPLLERAWPRASTEPLVGVGEIVHEFHVIDATNEEFRYATKRDGAASLKNAPRRVSLENLKSRMEELHHFFTGCVLGMSDMRDRKYERE